MKKKIKMLLALIMCAVLLDTGFVVSTPSTVSAAAPIKSTINMVTKRSMTVVKGNRYRMKAVINGKIIKSQGKWASSNKKVATVSKTGIIKAVRAGKTKISVKYKGRTLRTVITVSNTCKHVWKTTKKATCETKGTKKCTVCGVTQSIAKTAHNYKTETWEGADGRGKTYHETTWFCNGCNMDMTSWTTEEIEAHQDDIDAMEAGILDWKCFGAGTNGVVNGERYHKYVYTRIEETYCTKCGEPKDKVVTDMYPCDINGNRLPDGVTDSWAMTTYEYYCQSHGFVLCEGCHLGVMPGYTCPRCKTLVPADTTEDNAMAARAAVAPQDVTIEEETNETPVDTETVTESVVSDNEITNETTDETVSETIVSENELN